MKKAVPLIVLSFCYLLGLNSTAVNANPKNSPPPIENLHIQNGYKTVEEAVLEFEKHFNRDLTLPFKIPPIPFTHYFGRFNDLEGVINDSLDIEFINEQLPENHYKIDIRPYKTKISIHEKDVLKRMKLQNGNDAMFVHVPGFDVLVFSIDDCQYMLSVDKRNTEKVSQNALVEIANSMNSKASFKSED
ncbi:hypothetical protein [Metabacillus malikii]|uniref:DUF4367 domain-containing protein n=1 Tax=Metabacillus malikii TaxID=1504265 RepID=A0ABT9ZK80_9BACI|nr:hypothetical protein [Metabacillus malikii]MDQ0232694.1 hypothetical protein [Metabacillus malikii]